MIFCRIGLHFMKWTFQKDGYCCPCGKQYLWAEDIR
jgi:dTDP-4-dehydrorhamnose 3,5-epimerase-like enzyme